MLGEARRRLVGYGDRVAFHEGSFLDPLPAADAVVASTRCTTSTTSRPRPSSTAQSATRSRPPECC
jgi:hypothetical protein